jgi:hypothetical protein
MNAVASFITVVISYEIAVPGFIVEAARYMLVVASIILAAARYMVAVASFIVTATKYVVAVVGVTAAAKNYKVGDGLFKNEAGRFDVYPVSYRLYDGQLLAGYHFSERDGAYLLVLGT